MPHILLTGVSQKQRTLNMRRERATAQIFPKIVDRMPRLNFINLYE